MEDSPPERPASLLPYDAWVQDALREVMARALEQAATEGLPGEHHFYITFRSDYPGVFLPTRLREKYPQEMTIVLQHQFHGLKVDREAGTFEVGLSFGGVPATLVVPLASVTTFVDPAVQYGLRFEVAAPEPEPAPAPQDGAAPDPTPQIVSLDAFRRRKD